jgi:hypothetical protein
LFGKILDFPATNKKQVHLLYLGFVVTFAAIAGIWSCTANRFRIEEIVLIILSGAVVGGGIALAFQGLSSLFRKV